MLPRLFSLLVILAPAATAGPAPDARTPTGQWTVDFADAQCFAVRNYGSVEEPVQLILKAPAIGGVVQVGIVRREALRAAAQIRGSYAIDDRPPSRTSVMAYSPKGSKFRVYSMNMPAAEFALLREAGQLSVRAGDLDERLVLSHMPRLLKIVDDCVADLRRTFNIAEPGTAATSTLQRRARGNLGRIFENEDYPAIALQRDQSGKVTFGLLIDETGRVADCTIVETSGVAALDAQSCAILKTRARLEPALGPDGKPAKDALTAAVVYRIRW